MNQTKKEARAERAAHKAAWALAIAEGRVLRFTWARNPALASFERQEFQAFPTLAGRDAAIVEAAYHPESVRVEIVGAS